MAILKKLNASKLFGQGRISKIVSLIVALAMVLAFAPCAFAEGEETTEEEAVYIISSLANPEECLVLSGDNTTNNTAVITWYISDGYGDAKADATGRQWKISEIGNGIYQFISQKANTMYMEVGSASSDESHGINIYTNSGSICQDWLLVPVDKDGETVYRIVNGNSGLSIQDNGHDETATQNLYTGADNQLFKIAAVSGVDTVLPAAEEDIRTALGIANALAPSVVLDMSALGDADGDGRTVGIAPTSDAALTTYLGEEWYWNGGTAVGANAGDFGWSGVNVILRDSINVAQFWTANANDSAPLYAEKESAAASQKDYYVYEFYPSYGTNADSAVFYNGEFAFYDDSHNYVTSFKYDAENGLAIIPQGTEDDGKFSENKPVSFEGSSISNTAERDKKLRLYISNDEGSSTYTVKWYYLGEDNAWTNFATQTYNGNVYGLGRMEAYRSTTDGAWAHIGVGDLKVYAGYYESDEAAADLGTITIKAHGWLPETVEVEGVTYSVDWATSVDTTVIGETAVSGTIETGREVNATISVVAVDIDDEYLTHYYSFDRNLSDEITGYEPTNVENASIVDGTLRLDAGSLQLQSDLGYGYKEITITAFYNFELWGKPWQRVFEFGTDTQNVMYYTIDNNYNYQSEFDFKANNTDILKGNVGGTAGDIGQWFVVTITYDRNGTMKVYRNGTMSRSATVSASQFAKVFTENSTNYIGASHWNDNKFVGYIDDLKIYNVALTASEVAARVKETPYLNYSVAADSALTAANAGSESIAVDDLGINYEIAQAGYNDVESYGFKLDYQTASDGSTKVVLEDTDIADGSAAAIFPGSDASNVVFLFTPYVVLSDGAKVYGKTVKSSLYTEVIKDITNADNGYTAENVNPDRVAKANQIIANGGVISFTELGSWRSQIMSITSENTIEINSKLSALGVGFLYSEANGIYVGDYTINGAVDGTVYTSLTLDSEAGTVTLSNPTVETAAAESIEIELQAVELEIIEEIIEEATAVEQVETELIFEEIL